MSESKDEFGRFKFFVVRFFALIVVAHLYLAVLVWISADKIKYGMHHLVRFRKEILSGKILEASNNHFLVLGDSTALRLFLPGRFENQRGVSLASYASYSPDFYFVFTDYIKSRGAPKCLLLSSTYGGYEYHIDDFFWQLLVPSGHYNLEQLIEFHNKSSEFMSAPGSQLPLPLFLLRALWVRINYFFDWGTLHQYIVKPHYGRLTPKLTYRNFRINRGAGPLNSADIFDPIPFDGPMQGYLKESFRPNPLIDFYFHRLLDEAKANNTRVLIYWGPLAKSLRTDVATKWVQDATQHISAMIDRHDNAENHLEIMWEPDINFTDGNHVNRTRGTEFTKQIQHDLQKCLDR